MKFILFSFLYLFLFSTSQSTAQNSGVDSILLSVSHLEGEAKLDAINEVIKIEIGSPIGRAAISALEQESLKQKDDYNYAQAVWCKMIDRFSQPNVSPDSMAYYANYLFKTNYKRIQVERLMFLYYRQNGYQELALHRAETFLKNVKSDTEEAVAYYMLASIYLNYRMGKESIDMAHKALKICDSNSIDNPEFIRELKMEIYLNLGTAYSDLVNDYNSCFGVNKKLFELLQEEEESAYKRDMLFNAYYQKVFNHFYLKQYAEAKNILDQLSSEKTQNRGLEALLEKGYAAYYFYIGEYRKSFEGKNRSLSYFTKENSLLDYITLTREKAEILDFLQNYKQASLLKSEIINITDSISTANTVKTLTQMQTIFQVERHKIEKEQAQLKLDQNKLELHRIYMIVIALIVVCSSFVTIILIQRRKAIQLREKNKILFDQYKHTPFDEIKVHTSESTTDSSSTDISSKQDIYNKAVEYLISTHKYVDAEFSREDLALQVGTNRQYLIEAIQENAKMTYSDFLNHLRLEHARKLLLQDNNFTIENILQQSGFNNRTTFYKHFNAKYGMTPAEFKKFVNEEKEGEA